MSRFTAVRDLVVARLSTISGYSVKTIAAAHAAEARPSTYPGYTVAMDEIERLTSQDYANAGQLKRTYRVPLFVQVFGKSYDVTLTGAELAVDVLDGQTPNAGMPSNTTRTHLVCGNIGERLVETGLVVMVVPVSCDLTWAVTVTFQG